MIKHIRLYKPHDIDLMAIQQAGFPLSTLFAIAIRSYANKNPVHIIFQDIQQYESFSKKISRNIPRKVQKRGIITIS